MDAARPLRRRVLQGAAVAGLAVASVLPGLVAFSGSASAAPASAGAPASVRGPIPTVGVDFSYTGGPQVWTPPAGVTSARFLVVGAGGAGGLGGEGGTVEATLPVVPGQPVQIEVGGRDGYNGGGVGAHNNNGGGASDVRTGACAADLSCGLAARVLVGGGGGGGGTGAGYVSGGDGGHPAGGNGAGSVAIGAGGGGGGGTQSAGGAGGAGGDAITITTEGGGGIINPQVEIGSDLDGTAGVLGSGGAGGSASDSGSASGGGGGGGYYGGGGGGGGDTAEVATAPGGGGGGGSSYAAPSITDASFHTGGSGDGSVEISFPSDAAQFVQNLYVLALGRKADPAGLTYWTNQIAAGDSYVAVAVAVASSSEASARLLSLDYSVALGRPPDSAGAAYWLPRLAPPHEAGRVLAALFGSHEGLVSAESSTTTLLTELYQALFDRAPDAGGEQYWLGRIGPGVGTAASRTAVALALIRSGEAANHLGSHVMPVACAGQQATAAQQTQLVAAYRTTGENQLVVLAEALAIGCPTIAPNL